MASLAANHTYSCCFRMSSKFAPHMVSLKNSNRSEKYTIPLCVPQHVMENCFYWRDPAHSARAGLHDLLRSSLRRVGIREVSLHHSCSTLNL